jgi:hypothetical protein
VSLQESVPTREEITRYLNAAGENGYVDAKGPCSWDDDATKASLAKDIVAFSNSEGGGAIVVGKSETAGGQFELSGLSPDQCKSFDTTKVAQWVNSRFSPSIRLTCCPAVHVEKSFVVIVVSEFNDKPAVCTRDTFKRTDGKFELAKGTIYVRTDSAESAPLQTPEQVSRLIGRAVVKQQTQLRGILDAVLAGRTSRSVPTDEEQFAQQLQLVQSDLLEDIKVKDQGAWTFELHPDTFEQKWNSIDELQNALRSCSLPHRRFPREYPQPIPREWGISDKFNGTWAMTYEGLFYFWRNFWENDSAWKSPAVFNADEENIAAGEWIDIDASVNRIVDLLALAQRFARKFDPSIQMRYQIRASQLRGRYLLRSNADADLKRLGFPPCAATSFQATRTISAGQIVSTWRVLCVDDLKKFVDLFPGGHEYIPRSAIEKWVEHIAPGTD